MPLKSSLAIQAQLLPKASHNKPLISNNVSHFIRYVIIHPHHNSKAA